MARSERLLELMQALRWRRRPVSAAELADELSVSMRTIYRDIQTLIGQGAPIEGEAGIGYVLKLGFFLPPLMFADEEIEALVLGSRWVAQRADEPLAKAARNALAKIAAVLPRDLLDSFESSGLFVIATQSQAQDSVDLAPLREAIRSEHKIRIVYESKAAERTERTLWPIAIAFFERVRLLTAWCELRQDYRHFRTDLIVELMPLGERYPRRRRAMLKEWRGTEALTTQE